MRAFRCRSMRHIVQTAYVRKHTLTGVKNDMFKTLANVIRDDEGATMVEYGIMVALIAAICIAVITTLGQKVSNAFSTVNASI